MWITQREQAVGQCYDFGTCLGSDKQVVIDNVQFGFTPGKSTTDSIFILRQLEDKYLSKKQELWLVSVDLTKTFDREPK